MSLFVFWPFSLRYRLEREQARALKALDRAEAEYKEAKKWLGIVDHVSPRNRQAKAAALRRLNNARKIRNDAGKVNLAAIDAIRAYTLSFKQ